MARPPSFEGARSCRIGADAGPVEPRNGLGRSGRRSSRPYRAGRRTTASQAISWRKPRISRIYSTDRVNVWVACDENVDLLREFHVSRDFPVSVSALPTTE
ncbi:hypothetical protein [Subtercola sp. YIM 133946]|uniref:hypothetical protein n=1 Tax=Subtercola sp. YIM 133946 TaxID=3118909 RepID=UPI002F91E2BA